jgi:hypothetical protein
MAFGLRAGCGHTMSRAYVIHPSSVAVSHEHRRAKTDRLDTELLRAFLGLLRAEKRHCSMAASPRVAEADARRPNRERDNLVCERIRIVNRIKAVLARFAFARSSPLCARPQTRSTICARRKGRRLPENTRAELRRNLGRLRLLREQPRANQPPQRLPRPYLRDARRHGGAAHPQAQERQLLTGLPGTALAFRHIDAVEVEFVRPSREDRLR